MYMAVPARLSQSNNNVNGQVGIKVNSVWFGHSFRLDIKFFLPLLMKLIVGFFYRKFLEQLLQLNCIDANKTYFARNLCSYFLREFGIVEEFMGKKWLALTRKKQQFLTFTFSKQGCLLLIIHMKCTVQFLIHNGTKNYIPIFFFLRKWFRKTVVE